MARKECFMIHKILPAIIKHCGDPSCSYVIVIWELSSLFSFMTNCQASHDHMITIYSLLYWLSQEAGREDSKLLLPAKGFLLPSLHGGGESFAGLEKQRLNVSGSFIPPPFQCKHYLLHTEGRGLCLEKQRSLHGGDLLTLLWQATVLLHLFNDFFVIA